MICKQHWACWTSFFFYYFTTETVNPSPIGTINDSALNGEHNPH